MWDSFTDEITKTNSKIFKTDSKQGLNMDNNADIEDYSQQRK